MLLTKTVQQCDCALHKINTRFIKILICALAGWLSCLEHCPIRQNVVGSIPDQCTYLGSIPQLGSYRRQPIDVSLTLMFLCLFLSKINEHILG